MANSPSRETALRDAPYQQVKRDNMPKVAGMLAELSKHGPGTPPPQSDPSSPAPAPPGDYYYNPEDVTITRETPKPSPQKGKQPVKDARLTQTYSFLPASWAGDTHEETDFLPISGREVKEGQCLNRRTDSSETVQVLMAKYLQTKVSRQGD